MASRPVASLLAVALGGLVPSGAWASNGLNMIGFGAESVAMGGADLAVARDTSALNTNPAGLAQIPRQQLDGEAIGIVAIDVGHRDRFSGKVQTQNSPVFGERAGTLDASAVGRSSSAWGSSGRAAADGSTRRSGRPSARGMISRRSSGSPSSAPAAPSS